jgi:putative spermidine/putrescine transport system ATP-binding protein
VSIVKEAAVTQDTPASAEGKRGTEIRLDHVTKDYGLAVPAVDDISLTIEPGEFMTFLGPSGSGKTTTLNLIAGFETLTAGTIALNGTEVGSLPPHKRNLGMLFQNYALFPHLTVAQNVAYPLRERKLPKPEIVRKVAEVLELVQLTGRDDNFPSQLSGGQQQRVALARAIVFDPKVLLLDEPLGALDRNLRASLQAEIRRIHREVGSTFVFVTHDQEEAMNLSDRIALFNAGHLEQVGTPEALYRDPETLFAARFLGDSNVFELDERPHGATTSWHGLTWAVAPHTVAAPRPSLSHYAVVVRPEDVNVTRSASEAPRGTNTVPARVRDVEFMGSYRTLMLEFGTSGVVGRARIDASESQVALGDEVVASWSPERQRIVAA